MKAGRYVYRLTCGDTYTGPKGLRTGTSGPCQLHGPSRIAGPGVSLYQIRNPDYTTAREDT